MLNLKNVRTPEQKLKMLELKKKNICLFCEKLAGKNHGYPVEYRGKFWSVVKNDFPYEGTKVHYLLLSNKHIDSLSEITPEAGKDLIFILKKISKKHSLPGGSFFLRFGDINYTGSSLGHLHAHVISGSKQSKKTRPITTVLGWNKK